MREIIGGEVEILLTYRCRLAVSGAQPARVVLFDNLLGR
jgi:hypothetical protein